MKIIGIDEKEIINNGFLDVYLVENEIDIYNEIARIMANKIKDNNIKGISTSFILPVGPKGQYKRFAEICNRENISCNNLITINMDEYIDCDGNLIPEDSPISFRGFMKRNLFNILDDKLKVKPENIFFPDPNNISQVKELIDNLGGVDICFGGIGINGHIAFNEPMSESEINVDDFKHLETRIVDIKPETILINSIAYGGYPEVIPSRCITISMMAIFKSKELRFYLEHNWQSSVLRNAIFKKTTPCFPATYLKDHEKSSITVSSNVLKKYIN